MMYESISEPWSFWKKNTNNKLVVYRSSIHPAGEDPGRNDVKLRMIYLSKTSRCLEIYLSKNMKGLTLPKFNMEPENDTLE